MGGRRRDGAAHRERAQKVAGRGARRALGLLWVGAASSLEPRLAEFVRGRAAGDGLALDCCDFEKVALDQGLQAPAFTALVFIFFAVLEGSGFRGGVAACEKDLGPTILKNWLVFVPATFINLGFVPLELRVLFINVVFFFWVIFLSLLINNDEASKQV